MFLDKEKGIDNHQIINAFFICRDDWIRTSDLAPPRRVL